MQPEKQIRNKLKQVLYRDLQKRLRDNFKRKPDTCANNISPLTLEGKRAPCPALCGATERRGLVCDERQGGVEIAHACPYWTPLNSKEQVEHKFRQDFAAMVAGAGQGEKHPDFPTASVLVWVLDEDIVSSPETEPEMEPVTLQLVTPKTSFWARLWPWNWIPRKQHSLQKWQSAPRPPRLKHDE